MTAAKLPPVERDRRLADALRANLRRRKTQARAREDVAAGTPEVPPPAGTNGPGDTRADGDRSVAPAHGAGERDR